MCIVSKAAKITIFSLSLLLLVFSKTSSSAQLRLQTIIPAPMLTYNYFRLIPRADMMSCLEGTIYVSQSTGKLMVCDGSGPPDPPAGVWTESNNVLFLTDSSPAVRVGIGTPAAGPRGKLEIASTNTFGRPEGVILIH
jgi:hypothetical protein